MRPTFAPAVLVILAFLLPTTLAGSPSAPEITDATNDVPEAHLDITKAYFTSTPSELNLTIGLRGWDLTQPVASHEYRARYTADFSVSSLPRPLHIEGIMWLADSSTTIGHPFGFGSAGAEPLTLAAIGVGTQGTGIDGSQNLWTVQAWFKQDPPSLLLSLARNYQKADGTTGHIQSGTVSGLVVRTYSGDGPIASSNALVTPYAGPMWRASDVAGPGLSFAMTN